MDRQQVMGDTVTFSALFDFFMNCSGVRFAVARLTLRDCLMFCRMAFNACDIFMF